MSMQKAVAARWAVCAVFFVNGATIGSWAAHIPVAAERLAISHRTLGLLLLGMAAGAVVAMPVAGALAARLGSARVVQFATVLFCLSFLFPALATTTAVFAVGLFLFGAANGAMDVSMNAHAVAVEKQLDRPVMSSFHGMFSLGGLVGSGLAALLLPVMWSGTHGILVTCAGLILGVPALLRLLPRSEDAQAGGAALALPNATTIGLGALCLLAFAAEGSVLDWSALHMRSSYEVGAGAAATGFAAFSATMAIGRFAGDRLRAGLGAPTLVRGSALLAAAGLGLSLVSPSPALAVLGFAIVGFGLANLVPVLFSAGGALPDQAAGTGIAAIATMGYAGFLAAPPVIGFIADATSLAGALGLVVLACVMIAVFAGTTGPRQAR